jgi:hypothetical protein
MSVNMCTVRLYEWANGKDETESRKSFPNLFSLALNVGSGICNASSIQTSLFHSPINALESVFGETFSLHGSLPSSTPDSLFDLLIDDSATL